MPLDIKPPMGGESTPAPFPTHGGFVESVPVVQTPSDQFFNNGIHSSFEERLHVAQASSPYISPPSASVPSSVDMSCVKQEPGFQSSFPSDPTRRTVSMDGHYPHYIKKELNPMFLHNGDVVRRQMSMPLNPNLRAPLMTESRRSSEPAIPMKPFLQTHPHPTHSSMSYPASSSNLSCPPHPSEALQRKDLYLVNLATYHHHQEMETRKRRELTKGNYRNRCNIAFYCERPNR